MKIENRIRILIKKDFDYHNHGQFQVHPRLKMDEYEKDVILRKNTQAKLSYQCKTCQKIFKEEVNLKIHTLKTHKSIRPYECEMCHKLFVNQSQLRKHKMTCSRQANTYNTCPRCAFKEKRKEGRAVRQDGAMHNNNNNTCTSCKPRDKTNSATCIFLEAYGT
uniref:C2H2-type domain-containing protein n=1 Tax=Trichogramma kaykai TaxID=54128 RepID=A0ABD2WRT5_9HYME